MSVHALVVWGFFFVHDKEFGFYLQLLIIETQDIIVTKDTVRDQGILLPSPLSDGSATDEGKITAEKE